MYVHSSPRQADGAVLDERVKKLIILTQIKCNTVYIIKRTPSGVLLDVRTKKIDEKSPMLLLVSAFSSSAPASFPLQSHVMCFLFPFVRFLLSLSCEPQYRCPRLALWCQSYFFLNYSRLNAVWLVHWLAGACAYLLQRGCVRM
jgi:hypothetical protein